MNKIHEEIGHIVRNYRQKSSLTQMDLAAKLGYNTPQFVSLFERGLSKIPLETLGLLIVTLGIPEKKVLKALMKAYEAEVQQKINQGKKAARG